MRHFFMCAIAAVVAVGHAEVARAQSKRQFGDSAWLHPPVSLPVDSVHRGCVALPYQERFREPPRQTACSIVRFVPLDSAAGAAWAYGLYRHASIHQFKGASTPDTVVELELVLFSSRHGPVGRLEAVAHVREAYDGFRDMSAAVSATPDGLLLATEFCLNGTGGCGQEYSKWDGHRWRAVADPSGPLRSYLAGLGVLSGRGDPRLGAPRIDPHTLLGTSSLYSPGDPNCCPSHRVEFALALGDTTFRVLRARVLVDSL